MIHLSLSMLVGLLIQLVIGGLILWLLWWFVGYVGLPEPVNKVARVLIALVAILWLISILMAVGGHPLFVWS